MGDDSWKSSSVWSHPYPIEKNDKVVSIFVDIDPIRLFDSRVEVYQQS